MVAWVVPGYSTPTAKDREFFGDEVAETYARSGGDGPPSVAPGGRTGRAADDLVVEKTARSAYFPGSSDLPALLAARGVDTVVITGTVTNVCVEDTVRDASATGLRVILVADACAAMRDQDHNATLHVVYRSYGDVRSTSEVLELVQHGSGQRLVVGQQLGVRWHRTAAPLARDASPLGGRAARSTRAARTLGGRVAREERAADRDLSVSLGRSSRPAIGPPPLGGRAARDPRFPRRSSSPRGTSGRIETPRHSVVEQPATPPPLGGRAARAPPPPRWSSSPRGTSGRIETPRHSVVEPPDAPTTRWSSSPRGTSGRIETLATRWSSSPETPPPLGGRVAREERAGVSRPPRGHLGGRVAREERAGVSRPPPLGGRAAPHAPTTRWSSSPRGTSGRIETPVTRRWSSSPRGTREAYRDPRHSVVEQPDTPARWSSSPRGTSGRIETLAGSRGRTPATVSRSSRGRVAFDHLVTRWSRPASLGGRAAREERAGVSRPLLDQTEPGMWTAVRCRWRPLESNT